MKRRVAMSFGCDTSDCVRPDELAWHGMAGEIIENDTSLLK